MSCTYESPKSPKIFKKQTRGILTTSSIDIETFNNQNNNNHRHNLENNINIADISFLSETGIREQLFELPSTKKGVRRRSCHCSECGDMTLLERKTATLESMTKTARTRRQKLKSLLKIQAEQRNSLFKKGIKSNFK